MTREEAIEVIKDIYNYTKWDTYTTNEARTMAIKALEQEPCPDAISRSDMLDATGHGTTYTSQELKGIIKALPPVNPQPNKEDIHREREQAYMLGYEDGSRKYRTEQCEDAISRQAALDIVDSYSESQSNVEDVTQDIISDIVALSPVNPQPKMGHWITKDKGYDIGGVKTWYLQIMCSECGFIKTVIEGHTGQYHYCPNCGAKMVDSQEGEEKE